MKLEGILFFPVTAFAPDGSVATEIMEQHVRAGMKHGPGAVFVAGGAGELHSLSPEEYSEVVALTITEVNGRVPVFAGVGGGLSLATDLARRAAAEGADGLLMLPPPLVVGAQNGLVEYVRTVADTTDLPVIFYQREGAILSPESAVAIAEHRNVIGIKDGIGDLDLLTRMKQAIHREVDDAFLFFNGMPTAEFTAKAYREIGIDLYSSAVFSFAPEVAVAFYRSLYEGDGVLAQTLLEEFYEPLVVLRDRVPGYAVALVKSGVRLRGLDVGTVRPPLVEPSESDRKELETLINHGLGLVGL